MGRRELRPQNGSRRRDHFTTEVAFIRAGDDLLRNGGGLCPTLPDGTIEKGREQSCRWREAN